MGKAAEKDDEAIDKNRSGKAKNNKGEGKDTQESGKEPQEKDREEGQRAACHRLVFGLFGGGILGNQESGSKLMKSKENAGRSSTDGCPSQLKFKKSHKYIFVYNGLCIFSSNIASSPH